MSLATVIAGCGSGDVGDAADAGGNSGGNSESNSSDSSEPGPGSTALKGSGVITISGVEYAFTSNDCLSTASSFEIRGSGETDAGSFDSRIRLDEAADLDGDDALDTSGDVNLTVGDDEAIYKSIVLVAGERRAEEFTFERADDAVTGSGRFTNVMAGGGEDFEFSAKCE